MNKRTPLIAVAALAVCVLALAGARDARALALGSEEFVAAREVTCILAQDALGFLAEDDFNELLDTALADFEEGQGDLVYAKALGYFDGLMFGIPESNQRLVNERLRSFNASQACTGLVSSNLRI